jgi:putative transposon-encoded protein
MELADTGIRYQGNEQLFELFVNNAGSAIRYSEKNGETVESKNIVAVYNKEVRIWGPSVYVSVPKYGS